MPKYVIDGLSRRYDGSRHGCVRRCERRPIREAQVRPHVTQVKPPVVGLTPALRCVALQLQEKRSQRKNM